MRNNIYKPSSDYESNFIKPWPASNTIKRYWFQCSTDPSYIMCATRTWHAHLTPVPQDHKKWEVWMDPLQGLRKLVED